jgi:methionine synthase / methylenetetrahydrofolate reductase(NADPH)
MVMNEDLRLFYNGSEPMSYQVKDFRAAIKGGPLIGDGAMATLLHQSGQPIRSCFEELSLTQPHLIKKIHKAYIRSGARVIQTNTFSSHRKGLERYGLGSQVNAFNRSAVKVAHQAISELQARDQVFLFGTVGSMVDYLKSENKEEQERYMETLFEEQVMALLEGGVDGILLETFPELGELQLAIDVVRRLTDLPIIANLSPVVVGITRDGVQIDKAFKALQEKGADVVGLNCRLGLSGILRTYEMTELDQSGFYSAFPNGGLLHMEDGAYSYTANANYFAEIGVDLVKRGVHLIGGCCGTTPEHIQALKNKLDSLSLEDKKVNSKTTPPSLKWGTSLQIKNPIIPEEEKNKENIDKRQVSQGSKTNVPKPSLIEKVKTQTTIVVELDPPRVLSVQNYLDGALALQQAGVDAVTLADNSLGTVRVSNMALARLLKEQGIEPLVHVACRDRNLIGQQSHLMGLHILGIHHILLVTGDPSKFGDLPGATSVYDVSSTELTRMVKQLNSGTAFSGQPLKNQATFIVGTSFNPHVTNFKKAIDRLKRKLDSGADYVMTQPIYDVGLFEKLAHAVEPFNVPVFAGIMPLTSARNAQFLHNEVPGISIPEVILERMNAAPIDRAHEEGLKISKELIQEARTYFNGLYLITPFLRYDLTVHLTRFIRETSEINVLRGQ